MRCFKFEDKIIDFVKKHFFALLIIITTLIALYVRFKMRDFQTGDYLHFLEPWSEEIKSRGIRNIFASGGVGNYNCPYIILLWFLTKLPFSTLFSIKLLSVVFDFGIAIMAALIVRQLLNKKNIAVKKKNFFVALTYIFTILLPTIVLNSALWAQCDSVYVFFALTSIYFLIKKKYLWSFVLLGCAFAFKLQFVFILPIYLIFYLKERRFSVLNFLIIPFMLIALSIPALVLGMDFGKIFGIYFEQVSEYKQLTLAMPNIYLIFNGDYEYVSWIGLGLVFAIFAALAYYVVVYVKKINEKNIIPLMLISVLVCICFLPSMHERYGYLADVLGIIYFMAGYGSALVPIAIEFVSLLGYFTYLFGLNLQNYALMGIVPIVVLFCVGKKIIYTECKRK